METTAINKEKSVQLEFSFNSKVYKVIVTSRDYLGAVVINKLRIGKARYWLIFQGETWWFIGDMPLCTAIKNILAGKVAAWHGLPKGREIVIDRQKASQPGNLLNVMQKVTLFKKQIH